MAIFVPNSPLAGFNVSTGSLQGPGVVLDELTGASTSTFLIAGGAVGDEFFISASNFNVKANGNITASNALLAGTITATAGFIGGWTIGSTTLQGGNVVLDSTGNIRTATNFTTGDGFFLNDQATNNFRVGLAGGSRLQFTGTNVEIYSSNTRVVSLGTVNEIAGFGLTPAAISSSNNNLVLRSNGQITGSSVLFSGGTIGGFTVSSTRITGSNIIIDSAGTIQTANYTPDITGWRIDAAGNGTAEFENVKIRGTLSTAVFEKQSVNAVGGQLYVANSTTLTGSSETGASTNGQYTATQTTMSVENVTGFETDEVISAKRFSGTGFATEYMRINSASRANPSSQTDFSGRIYVTRALGSGTPGISGSLGETPSAGQPYSGSQVIVSTGKLGTGFIRINANPNDTATPYIDIVERTGSGVYDVRLKARLGDLSGLSGSSYVFSQSNPGFGLATDNVFLQGGITATFGSIGGFSISSTTISSSNDDLILRSNGQITGSNILLDGGKIGATTITPTALIGGLIQTSDDTNKSRIVIDGTSDPATMTFYSASNSQFTLSSNITYFAPDTPSKGSIGYTLSCPARTYISTGKGGLVLTNGMIFQGSTLGNLQIQEGGIKVVAGDQQTYTLDITRQIDCITGVDTNANTGTGNFTYYNKYTLNGTANFRTAVRAISYNGWSGSLGTYVAMYADASTNNASKQAYSFYGAGGKIYNADEVILAGGGAESASLHLEGYNQRGGAGYHDYMMINNTGGGTNPKKWHRINSTGAWEVLNSTYTTTIFSLTNAGVLSTPGGGTSDKRVKNSINYITGSATPIIGNLKPTSYEFNDHPGITRHGFIAQDVLEVKPDLVLGDGDQADGTYGLDYDGILALTVKALQEANAKIDALEARISTLESGSI